MSRRESGRLNLRNTEGEEQVVRSAAASGPLRAQLAVVGPGFCANPSQMACEAPREPCPDGLPQLLCFPRVRCVRSLDVMNRLQTTRYRAVGASRENAAFEDQVRLVFLFLKIVIKHTYKIYHLHHFEECRLVVLSTRIMVVEQPSPLSILITLRSLQNSEGNYSC